jgi:hypothetical protein
VVELTIDHWYSCYLTLQLLVRCYHFQNTTERAATVEDRVYECSCTKGMNTSVSTVIYTSFYCILDCIIWTTLLVMHTTYSSTCKTTEQYSVKLALYSASGLHYCCHSAIAVCSDMYFLFSCHYNAHVQCWQEQMLRLWWDGSTDVTLWRETVTDKV